MPAVSFWGFGCCCLWQGGLVLDLWLWVRFPQLLEIIFSGWRL